MFPPNKDNVIGMKVAQLNTFSRYTKIVTNYDKNKFKSKSKHIILKNERQ
jgi:hypothetical protein